MLKMIAAVGKNNELGKNNNLIWHLKEDLSFFKETTMGSIVAMGENTFKSLPKVLPGRKNIVFSVDKDFSNDDIIIYHDISLFLKDYKTYQGNIFIIGGASIYKYFIDLVSEIYLTEIEDECKDADVFFPSFDKSLYQRKVLSHHEIDKIKYSHVLYIKK